MINLISNIRLSLSISIPYAIYRCACSVFYKIGAESLHYYFTVLRNNSFSKYIGKRYSETIELYKNKSKKEILVNDFKVWVFWAQGFENAPDLVKACNANLKNICREHVVELNMDNFAEHVSIPSHVIKKVENGQISLTHFSDILRLSLLAQHGGFWIDSTCWVSKEFMNKMKTGEILTLKSEKQDRPRYISNNRWTIWAIGTTQIDHILFSLSRDILFQYWASNESLVEFFIIDHIVNYIYNSFDDIKIAIDNASIDGTGRFDLMNNINKPFNEDVFNSICSNNIVSKLSYKGKLMGNTNDGEQTLFGRLITNYK